MLSFKLYALLFDARQNVASISGVLLLMPLLSPYVVYRWSWHFSCSFWTVIVNKQRGDVPIYLWRQGPILMIFQLSPFTWNKEIMSCNPSSQHNINKPWSSWKVSVRPQTLMFVSRCTSTVESDIFCVLSKRETEEKSEPFICRAYSLTVKQSLPYFVTYFFTQIKL